MKHSFCPVCESCVERLATFETYNGLTYFVCSICTCHVLIEDEARVSHELARCDGSSIDPDGCVRYLEEEREFKIKNWYGDIIQYLNYNYDRAEVLDFGCGLGFLADALSERHTVDAYDISPRSRLFVSENFPSVNCLSSLNYLDSRQKYDVVICYHVIEHVRDPKRVVAELYSLLKNDGVLILGTPNIQSPAAKRFGGRFRLYDPGHLVLLGHKQLRQLLRKQGFMILKTEYPFLKTDYFTIKNLWRYFLGAGISPAFYGSIMTVYAKRIN